MGEEEEGGQDEVGGGARAAAAAAANVFRPDGLSGFYIISVDEVGPTKSSNIQILVRLVFTFLALESKYAPT